MSKRSVKRAFFSLIFILTASWIISFVLDVINIRTTTYIYPVEDELTINQNLNKLIVVDTLEFKDDTMSFDINTDGSEYVLYISHLTFNHEIYLNNELYTQNIDIDKNNYNGNYAYKTILIGGSENNVFIKGNNPSHIDFFIGKKDFLYAAIEVKTILYTIKLMCLFLLVFFFAGMYFFYDREKRFWIFILIGIVSIVKSIVLGELPVLSGFLNINIEKYYLYDNITTILNTILPMAIMLDLFDIKTTKKTKSFIGLLLLFTILILYTNYLVYLKIIFIVFLLMKIIITLYGVAYQKKYYRWIRLNGIIYFSFAVFELSVLDGKFRIGILNFYTNMAYIGAIIYLVVFAIIFLNKYLNGIRVSKEVKKEMDRIALLRGLGHDLKLPLSVIKISSQMIESQNLNSKQIKEYANDITEEVDTLSEMADNINFYLKMGHKSGKEYRTNVEYIFNKLERHFNALNKDNTYEFNVLYGEKDFYVNIDELELYRLLYNLVDNAFKYSKAFDKINVSYMVNDNLIIIVEDSGEGMNSSELENIFSPFYRLDQSRNINGMGLGLSVVKGIVDKYDGEITVDSEIGKGTKIEIAI